MTDDQRYDADEPLMSSKTVFLDHYLHANAAAEQLVIYASRQIGAEENQTLHMAQTIGKLAQCMSVALVGMDLLYQDALLSGNKSKDEALEKLKAAENIAQPLPPGFVDGASKIAEWARFSGPHDGGYSSIFDWALKRLKGFDPELDMKIGRLRYWGLQHGVWGPGDLGNDWLLRLREVLSHIDTEAIAAGVKACREARPDLWVEKKSGRICIDAND